jgi:hypothetical protein
MTSPGSGRVNDYRPVVLEDDLVVAQITKSILWFLGRNDAPSVLPSINSVSSIDIISTMVYSRERRHSKGGLAPGRSAERRNFFMRTCMAASGSLTLHADVDFPSATLPAHSNIFRHLHSPMVDSTSHRAKN